MDLSLPVYISHLVSSPVLLSASFEFSVEKSAMASSSTSVFPSRPDSSSFQSSCTESVSQTSAGNGCLYSTGFTQTPLSGKGYCTPSQKEVNACQSCHSVFQSKRTLKHHVKYCKVKKEKKKRKRTLKFETSHKKKRDLFEEFSSSTDNEADEPDGM